MPPKRKTTNITNSPSSKRKKTDDINDWSGELIFNIEKDEDSSFQYGVQGKKRNSWLKYDSFGDFFNLFWTDYIWNSLVEKNQ
jgi:hypothetical protein